MVDKQGDKTDLALVEANGDVQGHVVAGEVGRLAVEVDGEPGALFLLFIIFGIPLGLVNGRSLDDEGLPGLDLVLEETAVGHRLKEFSFGGEDAPEDGHLTPVLLLDMPHYNI